MTSWVLDLDGVVWLGARVIPGAPAAVARLRDAGHRVGFCTNNSNATVAAYAAKLARAGIPFDDGTGPELITSAMAAVTLIRPGERVLVCGGPGVREALAERGAIVAEGGADPGAVDAVMVGFHTDFDYAAMKRATRAVQGGARLIATNDDPVYPSDDGVSPGCGAILASIERATGTTATVAGKPNQPMSDLVRARFGDDGVMVGDSLGTDGALAAALDWTFGLVLSGNTGADAVPPGSDPAWVAADLAALVDRHLAG